MTATAKEELPKIGADTVETLTVAASLFKNAACLSEQFLVQAVCLTEKKSQ